MQTIWKRGNVLNKGEGAFVSSAHFVQLSMMYNQHSHSFISILTLLFVFFIFTTWNELVSEIGKISFGSNHKENQKISIIFGFLLKMQWIQKEVSFKSKTIVPQSTNAISQVLSLKLLSMRFNVSFFHAFVMSKLLFFIRQRSA